MYFDRFDICEAYYVWAHDWGEYNAIARLGWLQFRARPSLQRCEDLEENARAMYDELNRRSEQDPDWFAKLHAPCAPKGWRTVEA